MRPLNLQEFAEDMRRKGDIRDADLADEILALLDIEAEVAEPYSTLCDEVEMHAPNGMEPLRGAEWLGDRSNLLEEIEKQLKEANRAGDVDDVVKEMIGTLADAEAILEANGWTEGDFLDGLQALADRAAPAMEYDL